MKVSAKLTTLVVLALSILFPPRASSWCSAREVGMNPGALTQSAEMETRPFFFVRPISSNQAEGSSPTYIFKRADNVFRPVFDDSLFMLVEHIFSSPSVRRYVRTAVPSTPDYLPNVLVEVYTYQPYSIWEIPHFVYGPQTPNHQLAYMLYVDTEHGIMHRVLAKKGLKKNIEYIQITDQESNDFMILCEKLMAPQKNNPTEENTASKQKAEDAHSDKLSEAVGQKALSIIRDGQLRRVMRLDPESDAGPELFEGCTVLKVNDKLDGTIAVSLRQTISSEKSYRFRDVVNNCTFLPEVGIVFEQGGEEVYVLISFYCDNLMVVHGGRDVTLDMKPSKEELLKLSKMALGL